MSYSGDVDQWTASKLSRIAMLKSSLHQRAEHALTDLNIGSTAMTKGWSRAIVKLYGIVEVTRLSCIPWELTPHGTPEPLRSQAFDHTFSENVLVGM
jgi:hypothetical protein